MFKKIKENRDLKRTYKNAKKVCVINGANLITNLNEIVTQLKVLLDTTELLNNLSKEDLDKMINFADSMESKDFQETVVKSIIDNIPNEE